LPCRHFHDTKSERVFEAEGGESKVEGERSQKKKRTHRFLEAMLAKVQLVKSVAEGSARGDIDLLESHKREKGDFKIK